MIELKQLKTFNIDYATLTPITYYFWMVEYVLQNLSSDKYTIKLLPDISGYGAHWGGLFTSLKDKSGGPEIICHNGLVYHPDTEIGIYFEAESFKNDKEVYEKLWRDAASDTWRDLNKDEPDFLKFFFPKDKLSELMNAQSVEKQIDMLTKYLGSCFIGMIEAAQ